MLCTERGVRSCEVATTSRRHGRRGCFKAGISTFDVNVFVYSGGNAIIPNLFRASLRCLNNYEPCKPSRLWHHASAGASAEPPGCRFRLSCLLQVSSGGSLGAQLFTTACRAFYETSSATAGSKRLAYFCNVTTRAASNSCVAFACACRDNLPHVVPGRPCRRGSHNRLD